MVRHVERIKCYTNHIILFGRLTPSLSQGTLKLKLQCSVTVLSVIPLDLRKVTDIPKKCDQEEQKHRGLKLKKGTLPIKKTYTVLH